MRILPGDPFIPYNLAAAICEAGRPEEALGLAEEALVRFPDHPSLLEVRAYCIEQCDGSDAARPAYEDTADALEEWLVEHEDDLDGWTRLMTIRSTVLNEPKRKERPIRKLVELVPDNPFFRFNLARLHYARGEIESALAEIDTALEDSPEDERDAALLNFRERVLTVLRRFDEAVVAGRGALDWKPNNAAAHWNLGNSLCYAGRLAEGVSE